MATFMDSFFLHTDKNLLKKSTCTAQHMQEVTEQ